MMILSISDVITNSSSETFCTIESDYPDILREIFDSLPNPKACCGDGGKYLDTEESKIYLDAGYDLWEPGILELLQKGILWYVEPYKDMIKINFDYCE